VLLLAPPASAHVQGLSTGEYRVKGSALLVKLAFARADVAALLPRLDADHDGHVTALEVEQARELLQTKVLDRFAVTTGARPCTGRLGAVGLTEQDGLDVEGRFDCPEPETGDPATLELSVTMKLLDDLPRGSRHVARAVGASGEIVDQALEASAPRFTVTRAPSPSPPSPDAPSPATATAAAATRPAPASHSTSAWGLFRMGVEHILTGYDHLAFLLALVLVRAPARSLVGVVTAFTVAHSITLAVAALGVLAPSPRLVEPAIALSIVYVAVENLFVRDGRRRWRVTFPFGLVHGFGFAGALQELALPRARVPVALVSFNLGVEVGQLLVLGLVVPILARLREVAGFEPRVVRAASALVAVAGVIWFVLRIVSA